MKNEISLSSLPADVYAVLRRRRRWRVIVSLLWYLMWGVAIWRYYVHNPDARPNFMLPLFVALLLLLPLWMFRLREVLFDRVWSGEVETVKYRMMSDIPVFSEGLERVERHETMVLYVRRTSDGKRKKVPCRRLWHAADRCYRRGDTVRHIPLLPLPQNLSRRPEGGELCLVCGTLSEHSGETCIECRHTIF